MQEESEEAQQDCLQSSESSKNNCQLLSESDPLVNKLEQNSEPQEIQQSKNKSNHSEYSSEQNPPDLLEKAERFQPGENIIAFQKKKSKHQATINQQKGEIGPVLPASIILPWLSERTRALQNPLIKLHNEIIEYYLAFRQQDQNHSFLLFLFNKLQGLLFKTFKNCDVLAPFLTNQVYLKNSEVQIFILFDSENWKSPQTIEKVRNCLQKINLRQIKFFQVQSQGEKQHKVGFNCLTQQKQYSIQAKLVTHEWVSYLSMINDVLQNNLESKFLYLIFNTMTRQRGLQNTVKSYLIFGLIAVFLQERKRQKSRSLTENLIKFVEYFGVGPFTERKISYKGMDRIYQGKNDFQIIQDQQNSLNGSPQFSFWIGTIDISNPTTRQFFALLRNRYRLISNFNFAKTDSVLFAFVNPNNEEFRY